MKGLKIIPMFLVLMGLTYAGMLFVQSNSEEIIVKMGSYQTPSAPIGLVVMSSIFLGMVVCGVLCSVEMLGLYVQNRKLKKKIGSLTMATKVTAVQPATDIVTPKATGRFT